MLKLEVKLIEYASLFSNAKAKVLLRMKMSLESGHTEVLLPSPVLVRPGFFYRIYISELPKGDSHYSKDLLTEIRMDSDIEIKFYESYVLGGKVVGLIPTLMFNRIRSSFAEGTTLFIQLDDLKKI